MRLHTYCAVLHLSKEKVKVNFITLHFYKKRVDHKYYAKLLNCSKKRPTVQSYVVFNVIDAAKLRKFVMASLFWWAS